jgi:LacI family transcriptional regulator
MTRCTLRQIAKSAGVSVSTISYALRHDPKIPAATALRINRIADRLGYRPNPAISALMAHIKAARKPKSKERIAFVWIDHRPGGPNEPFDRQCIEGARSRAEEAGYEIDEFHLTDPGMSAARLNGILRARGISGVVFSGCETRTEVNLHLDWNSFSCAVIGNARWNPELHRAGHYHFMGMRRIMLELSIRGYTRPAVLLQSNVDDRANRTWEGAFLAFHPNPPQARRFLLRINEPIKAGSPAEKWLYEVQPDALIVTHAEDIKAAQVASRKAGIEMGFVVGSLDWKPPGVAGIDPGHSMIAANAVDLVLGQIHRNERGIPAYPKELLFDGHWVEGSSLRQVAESNLAQVVI